MPGRINYPFLVDPNNRMNLFGYPATRQWVLGRGEGGAKRFPILIWKGIPRLCIYIGHLDLSHPTLSPFLDTNIDQCWLLFLPLLLFVCMSLYTYVCLIRQLARWAPSARKSTCFSYPRMLGPWCCRRGGRRGPRWWTAGASQETSQ